MRWALTGTPGTGKTTVAELLDLDRPVVHLGTVIREEGFVHSHDDTRRTEVADLDALASWLREQPEAVLLESHLAHRLPVDRIVVLRCHPQSLEKRLASRGYDREKISENVASERHDIILAEAVEAHGFESVFEIDTSERDPAAVAREVTATLRGRREPQAGTVSFLEEE